jgi:hypothetical protein
MPVRASLIGTSGASLAAVAAADQPHAARGVLFGLPCNISCQDLTCWPLLGSNLLQSCCLVPAQVDVTC